MSSASPAATLQLSRKRLLTPEQDPQSPILDRDAKKIRMSPTTPSTSRPDKKRRRKKKRATSVVEGKLNRGNNSLDKKASNASIQASAKPVPLLVNGQPNGDANEPKEPIASSSHPASEKPPISAPPSNTPSSPAKVEDLASPAASSSSKGKESVITPRSSTPLSLPKTQDLSLSLEAQIADLKSQLAVQREKLENQSNLVSTFQQSLVCQICIDLMYKPYVLSPCGHLVCHDCLVRWFKTPPPSAPLQENYNPVHKRKTCPHCRTVVRERPVEVYIIKDMVDALDKSGFAVGLPPREKNTATTFVREAASDPWQGIFPKHPAGRNHAHPLPLFIDDELPHDFGPLRLDLDSDDGPEGGDRGFRGLYDQEDAVYRCEDCMHEIWDGICTECGRIYAGFQEPVDLADMDDEDEDLGQTGFHLHIGGPGFMQAALMNQAMHLGLLGDLADEDTTEGEHSDSHPMIVEEADEEDGYESSFIDDEGPVVADLAGSENDPIVISSPPRPARRVARTGNSRRSVVVISSDEEDGDMGSTSVRANRSDSTHSGSDARPISRRSRTIRGRRLPLDDEGTSRNSDQIRWDSDDEGSYSTNRFASPISGEGDDDGSISRPPINLAHLLQDGSISDEDDGTGGSFRVQLEEEPSSDGSI